jgi:L-amino acid N-acyltransferase YncA
MILSSKSLKDFKAGKACGLKSYVNSTTGEEFQMLLAKPNNGGQVIFVRLSESLKAMGKLSAQWIREHLNHLQVVELSVEEDVKASRRAKGLQVESYVLCTISEVQADPMEGCEMI